MLASAIIRQRVLEAKEPRTQQVKNQEPSQNFTTLNRFQTRMPVEPNPVSEDLDRLGDMRLRLRSGATTPTAPSSPAPSPGSNRPTLDALEQLSGSFEQIDTSRDGFLSEQEIGAFTRSQRDASPETRQALAELEQATPILMFSTIQSGEDAFFGLSPEDLGAVRRRLQNGESLDQIQDQISNQLHNSKLEVRIRTNLNGGDKREAVRSFVNTARARIRGGGGGKG